MLAYTNPGTIEDRSSGAVVVTDVYVMPDSPEAYSTGEIGPD